MSNEGQSASPGAVDVKRATIHDLGYKRYLGSRRPQSTRWRVIVRNQLSSAWKGWWRYKIWLGGTFAITVGLCVAVHLARASGDMFDLGSEARAEVSGQLASMADMLLPMSFGWYGLAAFIATLTVLAGVIPRDLSAGAFQFYFSRPVRPVDYLFGKLGGAALLMAPFLLAGPLIVSLYRLGLSTDDIVGALPWVAKAFAAGLIATLVYATIPLGFGALFSRSKHAVGAWAAFFILISIVAGLLSHATGIGALAAIDPTGAVQGLAFWIFDVEFFGEAAVAPVWASALSVTIYVAISFYLALSRVQHARARGLGGAG